jgi:hypothetical protein
MMIGLRAPRVGAAMAAYGFTNEDLDEGWKLLRAVSGVKLDAAGKPASADTIANLDAWENKWFPIAAATLERRFPAVHAQVFKNLSQTKGIAVVVSVRTFIDRFEQMAAGAGSFGTEGVAAAKVLESRGLTQAVIAEARAQLESVGKITIEAETATFEHDEAELAKAEDALWSWYLEWSQIARIAVKQRSLLRSMGFGPTRKSGAGEGEEEGDGEEEPHAVVPVTNGIATPVAPHA